MQRAFSKSLPETHTCTCERGFLKNGIDIATLLAILAMLTQQFTHNPINNQGVAQMNIEEYLNKSRVTSSNLSKLADEMAIEGIDYISQQHLAGELRRLGWTYKNTGSMRIWIRPGQTALSAGVSKPANIRFIVGQAVTAVLAGVEKISSKELHEAVINKIGKCDENIVFDSMDIRASRKEWRYDQSQKLWIKI